MTRGASPGERRGGRLKGTPNKATLAIAKRLEAFGCDPIEGMAKIAMDEAADVALRVQCYKELAQYIYPKRKAIDHSGDIPGSSPPVFVIDISQKPQ